VDFIEFHGKCIFFVEEGRFQGTCHSCEIMKYVPPYVYVDADIIGSFLLLDACCINTCSGRFATVEKVYLGDTGGALYDGQQQVLYWADVSTELAFVVPSPTSHALAAGTA